MSCTNREVANSKLQSSRQEAWDMCGEHSPFCLERPSVTGFVQIHILSAHLKLDMIKQPPLSATFVVLIVFQMFNLCGESKVLKHKYEVMRIHWFHNVHRFCAKLLDPIINQYVLPLMMRRWKSQLHQQHSMLGLRTLVIQPMSKSGPLVSWTFGQILSAKKLLANIKGVYRGTLKSMFGSEWETAKLCRFPS